MLVLTLTAIATEAAASDDFKPSTLVENLFSANNQPDDDPFTRIAPHSPSNSASSESVLTAPS